MTIILSPLPQWPSLCPCVDARRPVPENTFELTPDREDVNEPAHRPERKPVGTTTWTVTPALSAGTAYFWRVTAFNAYGMLKAGNGPFSFTTPQGDVDALTVRTEIRRV